MKIYLYCNKTKPYLYNKQGKFFLDNYDLFSYSKLNEKVIASCELDNIVKITKQTFAWHFKNIQLYKPFDLSIFNLNKISSHYNFVLDKNGEKCVVLPANTQELMKLLNNEQNYVVRYFIPTECFEYNKYQKALDRLSTCLDEINAYQAYPNSQEIFNRDIKILQETINKANMFDKLKVNENVENN